jgi:thymidylate synthase
VNEFSSADEVQRWAIDSVLTKGISVSPRGQHTLEISPASFTLLMPRRRCIAQLERKWSLPLAVGEFLWHASASDDASVLEYYAGPWASFAVEGRIRGSCYGKSIFTPHGRNPSQWITILRMLQKDPDSRRAVLDFRITDQQTQFFDAPDVACVSTLQFLIRGKKLNAIAVMRSNDVIWGLPYDIFVLTMFQEMAAQELGLELGWYHHHAASLHIYDRHLTLARTILGGRIPKTYEMGILGKLEELPIVIEQERRIRQGLPVDFDGISSPSWIEIIRILADFRKRKT